MTSAAVGVSPGRIAGVLACPECRAVPEFRGDAYYCRQCQAAYPVVSGVLDLRPPHCGAASEQMEAAWSQHWSDDKQRSASQRFFSVYRKAIFARTVAHFVNRYLPRGGVLVEAGSGTSETSLRIDKSGGRTLVAVDLIRPVLERCHPVMDVRVCGDIFQLPFASGSLDGIWNVGVMEHFPHSEIDRILREFHRVLKPGGRIVLLWPAVFSVPQRILRTLEFFLNLRRGKEKFRFHPDEISQLRSVRQGRDVLTRNGYRPVAIDIGLRSLMAFETLVGEKDPTCPKRAAI